MNITLEQVTLTYEEEKLGEATVRHNLKVYGQGAKISNKRVFSHPLIHTKINCLPDSRKHEQPMFMLFY